MYVLCMFVNLVFSQLIIASIKGVYKNGGGGGLLGLNPTGSVISMASRYHIV